MNIKQSQEDKQNSIASKKKNKRRPNLKTMKDCSKIAKFYKRRESGSLNVHKLNTL